jgi:hypothetical protein
MGLYVQYKNAIRVQVPRDLHIGNEEFDSVEIGDNILVELKRSKFQINDPYILASGIFVTKGSLSDVNPTSEEEEDEKEEGDEVDEGEEKEEEDEEQEQEEEEKEQQSEDEEEAEEEEAEEAEEEEEEEQEDDVEDDAE